MIDKSYAIGVIAAMGGVTFALRAVPFVAGLWLQKHPVVQRLGHFLPLAIMALLTVNSMVGMAATDPSGPWPEGLSGALVAMLQWRTRNALLSILLGTGVYVVLRNTHWLGA